MNCCSNLLTPQCQTALSATPALTRVLLAANLVVYAVGFLVPRDSVLSAIEAPGHFCLSAVAALEGSHQLYRIISTAFFHLSLMHIAFNCMTLHNVGSAIEARTGTLSFALCTAVLVPGCGIMNVAASWLFNAFGYDQSMKECAAGFSGVLFAYVTIQALHRDSVAYSIYGFFSVPAKWYPLCMLVITQILLPQSSFVGHFGGIIAGMMFSIIESRLPSFVPCFQHAESICHCPAISAFCVFIPHPSPQSLSPPRYIPGVIIGDSFIPSHNPHVATVDLSAAPSVAIQNAFAQYESAIQFLSRYQQIEHEMQPPPEASASTS